MDSKVDNICRGLHQIYYTICVEIFTDIIYSQNILLRCISFIIKIKHKLSLHINNSIRVNHQKLKKAKFII